MKEIAIGIIDSMVYTSALSFRNIVKTYFCKNGTVIETYEKKGEIINHGTICAKILDYNLNANIQFTIHCINIWEKEHNCFSESNLLLAFKWFMEKNIKFVSMSIGTIQICAGYNISEVVKKFCSEGGVVFAANNNDLKYSIPAALPQVISVNSLYRLKKSRFGFLYNSGETNKIIQCKNCIKNEPPLHLVDSNSYATPKAVAFSINKLEFHDLLSFADNCSNKIDMFLETGVSLNDKFFLPDFSMFYLYLGVSSDFVSVGENILISKEKLKYCANKSVLLILDNYEQWNQFKLIVKKHSEKICGVAKLFKNEKNDIIMDSLQKHLILWDIEDYYNILHKILKNYISQNKLEIIPIVVIQYSTSDNLIGIMNKMENLLIKEKLNIQICSDFMFALFRGIPYIPKEFFVDKMLEFLVDFYSQDLLIYYCQQNQETDKKIECDLILNTDKDVNSNFSSIIEMFCEDK